MPSSFVLVLLPSQTDVLSPLYCEVMLKMKQYIHVLADLLLLISKALASSTALSILHNWTMLGQVQLWLQQQYRPQESEDMVELVNRRQVRVKMNRGLIGIPERCP